MSIDKNYVLRNYPRLIDDIRQSLNQFKIKNKIDNIEDDEAIIDKAFYRIWQKVKNGGCESPMQVASQTWQDCLSIRRNQKMDYCKIAMVGRTCGVPKFQSTQSGKFVATVNFASSRKKGRDYKASFLTIEGWGVIAERLQNVPKGSTLAVVGDLRVDSWEKDGVTHSRPVVTIDTMQLMQLSQGQSSPSPQSQVAVEPTYHQASLGDDFDVNIPVF